MCVHAQVGVARVGVASAAWPPCRAASGKAPRLCDIDAPPAAAHATAALVFQGVGFIDVGLAVFAGRLAWLAERHIVPCGPKQAARSTDEWVQLLRARLQPLPPEQAGRQ